ncbi:unnamed protein product, partial [Ectocarpus sp. 12 AP-2014]
ETNNAECGYDGGDCCSCDCVDTDYYGCGENGYDCQDVDSACYGCVGDFISDGWCDEENNNAECGYDGGDCCSCDCVD